MKEILILGGSYAGISVSHRILKQTSKSKSCKITMVSPNTDVFWNMASPRAAAGVLEDEKVFRPIAPGFSQYGHRFDFQADVAESFDPETKTVGLASGKKQSYDILIIATGSRTNATTPFKGSGSTEETKEGLHLFQDRVKASKTIVIGGGGPTGVEFAGELAFAYKKQKQVHLIASGPALSDESPPSVQTHALKALTTLGVTITLNTRVINSTILPSNQTQLTLSDNSTLTTDFYVATHGFTPNTSFLPAKCLNSKGFIITDEYLKVTDTNDIWAVGDVVDKEWKQFRFMESQAVYVAKSIASILHNSKGPPGPYKATTPSGRLLAFSLGPKNAVGAIGNFKLPNFVVSYARRDLFMDWMEPMVSGKLF